MQLFCINDRSIFEDFMKLILILLVFLALVGCGETKTIQVPVNTDHGNKPSEVSPNSEEFLDPFYFMGTESIPFKGVFECFVEVKYSEDLQKVQVRAVATHPHDPDKKQIAMGVLQADYDASGNFYRFLDSDPSAPVADMVLTAPVQLSPTRYGALILHGNHHDPISCEGLTLVEEGEALQKSLLLFSKFNAIKSQNP
jgi:hypothetical protein